MADQAGEIQPLIDPGGWSGFRGKRSMIHRGGYPPLVRASPSRSFTRNETETKIMKHHKLMLLTLLAAAACTVGCNKEGTTAQQFDKVQAKTEEAAQDMKDYSYAQKNEFVEKMQSQLTEINKDLDQLAAKIEKSSDAAKAEAKPKLEALRGKADQLGKRLDEVKNATESTWNDVKAGFRKGYGELKDSFQQARQWASDKIAP